MVLRAPESSLASIPTRVPRHWPHLRNPGTERTWGGRMTVPSSVRRPCPVPPSLLKVTTFLTVGDISPLFHFVVCYL